MEKQQQEDGYGYGYGGAGLVLTAGVAQAHLDSTGQVLGVGSIVGGCLQWRAEELEQVVGKKKEAAMGDHLARSGDDDLQH